MYTSHNRAYFFISVKRVWWLMKWTFKVYFINNVNRNLEKYFLAVLVFVEWITWGIYCRTTCKRNLIVPHLSELRKSLGFSKNLRCLEDSLSSEREGLEPRQPLRLSISVVSTANSLCWFSIVSQIILNLLTKHIYYLTTLWIRSPFLASWPFFLFIASNTG